jgi:death-on-curing protein
MAGVEPIWVREDAVLAIHDRQIVEHGGEAGLRDPGLLASALARPRNLLAYGDPPPDPAALAAAYAFGIARDHPFVDGNKRTAYIVCRTFLILNGLDFRATAEEKYIAFLRLAEGSLSQEELAAWIRERMAEID